MDPSMISSALCKRSQAICLQEMVSESGENPFPSDHYSDLRTKEISTALKMEQSYEVDMAKVEMARKLLAQKELLLHKRDSIKSVLNAANITAEELQTKKDRVKPLNLKRSYVEQLLDNCEKIRQEIAQLQY
ncbi:hypothetical protein OSTOST_10408 [Ostertagia ostertagi]